MVTNAPRLTSASAVARPRPEAPPVTRVELSARSTIALLVGRDPAAGSGRGAISAYDYNSLGATRRERPRMLADMYLCASTVDGASFRQRLEAASAGGYAGIGLRPSHYQAAPAEGR